MVAAFNSRIQNILFWKRNLLPLNTCDLDEVNVHP